MWPMIYPPRIVAEANTILNAIQPEIDIARNINGTTRMQRERMTRRTELEESYTPKLIKLEDD